MCPLFFNSNIRVKILKKEKIKETHTISIKNTGGVFGQTIKIIINTTDSKNIFVLPKIFDLYISFDL